MAVLGTVKNIARYHIFARKRLQSAFPPLYALSTIICSNILRKQRK